MALTKHSMIPVAPPHTIDNYYRPEEVDALFGVVKNHGPWPLISALHFKTAEEYLAVSGGKDRPKGAKLTDYTSPSFRGYLGKGGVCYYEEVHDIYFDKRFIDIAMKMHGAKYGLAQNMLFNIAGPSHSYDSGHFDGATFRGLSQHNTPTWLLSVMAKSGLFDDYKIKTSQVITYFYESGIDGGFTYWPEGPDATPARLVPPLHNTAMVSDNSEMFHRREANGPKELRDCPELDIITKLHWAGNDEWVLSNDGVEIGRFTEANRRALFHWTGLVFDDRAEVDKYLEHTDDLPLDKVFDVLITELKAAGYSFPVPTDPINDQSFIELLTSAWEMAPSQYPEEAPVNTKSAAA